MLAPRESAVKYPVPTLCWCKRFQLTPLLLPPLKGKALLAKKQGEKSIKEEYHY